MQPHGGVFDSRRARRPRPRRGAAGLVAIAMAAVLLAVAPASAQLPTVEEPGSLAVSSPFPPFVIVKAGEAFQVDGTAVNCPTSFVEPTLRIVSLGDDGVPNGFVDAEFPGDVPAGVPFDFEMSITLSGAALQGTYELVAVCEDAYSPESDVSPGGDDGPGDGVSPGDDDGPDDNGPGDGVSPADDDGPDDGDVPDEDAPDDIPIVADSDAPATDSDGDEGSPREVLEIQPVEPVIGATGWLVVGDENRLPPSSGTAEVPDGEIRIGEEFTVRGEGFAGDSAAEVWLYSDPILLGAAAATAVGALTWEGAMPTGTTLGAHTVVIAGQSATGRPLFLTAGVNVGAAAAPPTTTTTSPGTTPTTQAVGAVVGTTAAGAAAGGATPAVQTTTTSATGPLPATGFGNGGLTVLALLLLVIGAAAVATSRRSAPTRH
ncbi:MAG: hypothetical protein JJU45_19415 [Acidimicrobiia bacterium]|nr:hypothetical protein [Acidimicrobiia bacterium]